MRILVTGGNGQLGRSIEKVSVDYPGYAFMFCDLPRTDITDGAAIAELLDDYRPDYIINCAAYTAVDRAEAEPDVAEKINHFGVQSLASQCRAHDIGLVHISTDYVYSGRGDTPIREDAPTDPINVYGQTKLAGDLAVEKSGCRGVVIRTSWLYSEFGRNFVRTMLKLGAEGKKLRVVDDQKGSPTYAPDLARAIMVLLNKGIGSFGIYHYCDRGETTWYGLAKKALSLAGIETDIAPVGTEKYPTPAKRPEYSVLSTEKIEAAGAAVPYWVDSLETCINALRECGSS